MSGGEQVVDRLVVTDDPYEASAVLARVYAGSCLELGRPSHSFSLRMAVHAAGDLTVSTAAYGAEGRARAAPVGTFVTKLVTAGEVTVTAGPRRGLVLRPGQVWRWDTVDDLGLAFALGTAFATVQLPLHVVDDVAAERSEVPAAGVRFLANTPVDAAAERYWADLTRFVVEEATTSARTNPLLRQHLVRTLAGAALVVFPNSTLTVDPQRGPGRVGPATVRRAVAHVHAHAAEAVTVADLARAAGIGVRALQEAFVQHVGQPPTAYLRQVRLERAHAELLAADPASGDTVAAVAARWGFAHAGRFSAAHRERYGVSPVTTLRR